MESSHNPRLLKEPPRGFTLVEMLVVLAIIIIVTSVALLGQNTFNRSLLLTDTAYTIALSIREAQSLGLSSRKFAGEQNAGYGVHFEQGLSTYRIFVDTSDNATGPTGCPRGDLGTPEEKPGNCIYESADGTLESFTLRRGFTISNICVKTTSLGSQGNLHCAKGGGALSALDIVFMRPNTDSIIVGTRGSPNTYESAFIEIKDPTSAAVRCVTVSKTGQVAVPKVCPS